ncbi:uncharacterized protein LOC134811253 isoform X2 [Bolinopsis microptera]|uniref:uncharacterized protein LOC134811253 isoform X2 n=1 Tax=Bolinopsis microptera TaxID=2820187 RepID=UPI00307A6C01
MLMDTCENEILVLGDGDFSYSASLVPSIMNQYHLTSTVFLSMEELLSTYGNDVLKKIQSLTEQNVKVVFSVDATDLPPTIYQKQYDSIHFNFPHSGGKGKISENRKLLVNIFKSLQALVKATGNIEIALLPGQGGTPADGESLRSKGNNWNIQEAAAQSGFILYSTNSLTETLQSLQPGSYIEQYLKESNYIGQSFTYRCNTTIGHFDELFSIVLDENERPSKRAKLEETETIDHHILKVTNLESKKMLFYPINKTKVLYPSCIRHDVSMWTDSATTPNIIPVLLECIGLALHQVGKREPEPWFNPTLQKYSHCFSITYSHPFEALSEQFVKQLAHGTVREHLAKSGFDLH